jgi:hypothetical protein
LLISLQSNKSLKFVNLMTTLSRSVTLHVERERERERERDDFIVCTR